MTDKREWNRFCLPYLNVSVPPAHDETMRPKSGGAYASLLGRRRDFMMNHIDRKGDIGWQAYITGISTHFVYAVKSGFGVGRDGRGHLANLRGRPPGGRASISGAPALAENPCGLLPVKCRPIQWGLNDAGGDHHDTIGSKAPVGRCARRPCPVRRSA